MKLKLSKKNLGILIAIILVIIIFPALMLLFSKYKLLSQKICLTLIGYGGAIIGGMLTLLGVKMTINDNKKQKEKELFFQYRPIISSDLLITVNEGYTSKIIFENKGVSELFDFATSCNIDSVEFKLGFGPRGSNLLSPNSKYTFEWVCPLEEIKKYREISFTIKGRTYLNVNMGATFTYKVCPLKQKINLVLIKTTYFDDLIKKYI